MDNKKSIGLIVNPIAGIGGAVGLKGTDGEDILDRARGMGAKPLAPQRCKEFLHELRGLKTRIKIITLNGIMGGNEAQEEGFEVEFLSDVSIPTSTELYNTSPYHTIKAAQLMKEKKDKISLICFIGGDGTARDIHKAIGQDIPCLGIPGGVKIHSSVFTTNPTTAGQLALQYLWGEAPLREAEIMDIDEDAFRDNRVISKLYGYVNSPYIPTLSQPSKMASPVTEDESDNKRRISQWIIEEMDEKEENGEDWYYLIGPGTTTKSIADELEEVKSLLGVDLFFKKKCIAQDLNEQQILEHSKKILADKKQIKIIVTIIGRQGFVFGRGNLQFSPEVLETIGMKNVLIIATKYKITTLPEGKIRVDTRNAEFDKKIMGYYRVLIDYGEFRIIDLIR